MQPFWTAFIVGALALIGTLVGHLVTHRENTRANERASALIAYRLEQLELKVEVHNNLIDRTYNLERQMCVVETRLNTTNERLGTVEGRLTQ